MNEGDGTTPPMTAGRLLREARQAQGLHIAALASLIKVAPKKLELLEGDRAEELPDATFTRALAQTVCRALKIDPAPVLALLPRRDGNGLVHVGEGLNAPFRARPTGPMGDDDAPWLRPAIWGPAVLLLVAALVYLLPAGWLPSPPWRRAAASTEAESQLSTAPAGVSPLAASAPVAIAASETTSVAASMPDAAASIAAAPAPAASTAGGADAPPSAPTASASVEGMGDAVPQATAPGAAAGDADHALVLHVTSDSWIEVIDGRGQALLARTVKPGESIGLDGALPLRLRIGNAPATAVVFRGQPVALAPYTRDNLARLELR